MAKRNEKATALDELMSHLESDSDASGYEKTASEGFSQLSSVSDLERALEQVSGNMAKTASHRGYDDDVNGDLEKMAEDVRDLEMVELQKEAQFYGRHMADAFASRLSDYNGLLDTLEGGGFSEKTAEDDYTSERLGEEDGVKFANWALGELSESMNEKVAAEREYTSGYLQGQSSAFDDILGAKIAEEEMAEDEDDDDDDDDDDDGGDYGEEKTSAEREYVYGFENGVKLAEEDLYNSGFSEGIKVAEEAVESGDDGEDDEDDGDDDDDDGYGEEKTSSDVALESYDLGYINGLDWLEKKAEEFRTFDFVYDLADQFAIQ